MFDDYYYLEWDLAIYVVAGMITFFLAYSFTDNVINSAITTAAVVGTAYVFLNHVM